MREFKSGARRINQGSFFTQQIQVQPPDSLINVIGSGTRVRSSPFSEGSWAPAVPPSSTAANKGTLKDMKIRAKVGVMGGDVKKEAHMAFVLGNMQEQRKNVRLAIRYYKRYFFCARILDDPVGASLALNRLGVAQYKQKHYSKSLQFHLKHREYTDTDAIFAANYNVGIT